MFDSQKKIFTRIHLQVGQYLMTLPQQLEPFTMQDNPQVTVALKYGKLPYTTQQGNQLLFFSNITYWVIVYFFENKIIYALQFFILIELPEHLADLWLESLARGNHASLFRTDLKNSWVVVARNQATYYWYRYPLIPSSSSHIFKKVFLF